MFLGRLRTAKKFLQPTTRQCLPPLSQFRTRHLQFVTARQFSDAAPEVAEEEEEEKGPQDQEEIAKLFASLHYYTGQQKGRKKFTCSEHADKFESWDELVKSKTLVLKEKGIGVKARKKILIAVNKIQRNERSPAPPTLDQVKRVIVNQKPGYGDITQEVNGETAWRYPTLHEHHLKKHIKKQREKNIAKGKENPDELDYEGMGNLDEEKRT